MDAQRRYWDTFTTLKRDAIYINRYQGRVEYSDRCVNIFFAITSSAAIGGWAIWTKLSFVWALMIAASQVLTAIKGFLPYRTRLSALNSLGPELDALALSAETDWFKVGNGLLTDEETHKLTMSLKQKCHHATSSHFKGMSLPDNKKLLSLADRDANAYMAGFGDEE